MMRYWIIGLTVMAIVSPIACGMASKDAGIAPTESAAAESNAPGAPMARGAVAGLDAGGAAPASPSADAPAMRRMIIMTGNMTVEVDR